MGRHILLHVDKLGDLVSFYSLVFLLVFLKDLTAGLIDDFIDFVFFVCMFPTCCKIIFSSGFFAFVFKIFLVANKYVL